MFLSSCKQIWEKHRLDTLNDKANYGIDNIIIRQLFASAPREIIFEDYDDGKFFFQGERDTGYFKILDSDNNRHRIYAKHSSLQYDDYSIVAKEVDNGKYQVRFAHEVVWITYYRVE